MIPDCVFGAWAACRAEQLWLKTLELGPALEVCYLAEVPLAGHASCSEGSW